MRHSTCRLASRVAPERVALQPYCACDVAVREVAGIVGVDRILSACSCAIILQAMTNLLVRDLPDDVHRALQRRAKSHGQSLQQYLSNELTRIAKRPSLAEVLDRIDRRSGGEVGLARAAKDVAEDREQR
jgi:plasmid stability protein